MTTLQRRGAHALQGEARPHRRARQLLSGWLICILGCRGAAPSPVPSTPGESPRSLAASTATISGAAASAPSTTAVASLPLLPVRDTELPGKPVRFDYQDIDSANGHLVIAHMNDASVVVVNTSDGSLVKVISGVPRARGVVVAPEVRRIFVTSSPNQLVIIDSVSLSVVARVAAGEAPDGVSWDALDHTVGVSDQGAGALSLIADAGLGARRQVALGSETGNVVFDAKRGVFWITVVGPSQPDRLVGIDARHADVRTTLPLPGCRGAHGLRIHPNGESAFIACEENSRLVRVDLSGEHGLDIAASGADPDVLGLDPGLGWLYVAAESGDLRIFDVRGPKLALIGRAQPGNGSHSVAVDAVTHHVFFPLAVGPHGKPILRILHPTGT